MSDVICDVVCRPRLAFRLPIFCALVLWSLVSLYAAGVLIWMPEVPLHMGHLTALGFFVYMFVLACGYYGRLTIIMDKDGLIVCGFGSFRSYGWSEVLGIQVQNAYVPGYQVYTRDGAFAFSALLFSEHRDLYARIRKCSRFGDMGKRL